MFAARLDGGGGLFRVHPHTQGLDAAPQQRAALGIQLHRHQPGRELHYVRLQTQAAQRIGRFQAEQAATDHHATAGPARGGTDGIQIRQGAVQETAGWSRPWIGGTNG